MLDNINYDKTQLCQTAASDLNAAALASRADYICFFYSQAALCPEFFNELDAAFKKPDAAAALFCTAELDTQVYYNPATLQAPCIDGAFAIKREAFLQLKGFDKRLEGSIALTDLSLRLRLIGKIIYYVPSARAQCKGPFAGESFAFSLYGRLLLSMKHESLRGMLKQSAAYFKAIKSPPHYAGVRRELIKLYLKAFVRLLPLCLYKAAPRGHIRAAKLLLNDFLFLRRGKAAYKELGAKPLVSVIVRTCGRPRLLREALISLRNQTYKRLEIIVCEDNEPHSEKMLREEFSDLKIKYLCAGKHLGRSRNGNAGLDAASGEWCAFLDDDDLLYPEHIQALLCAAESELGAKLILASAAALYCESCGNEARRETALRPMVFDRIDIFTMCLGCQIPIQAALFKRELYEKAGGLHESLNAHEDWAMWLKFLAKNPRGKAAGADVTRITSLFTQPANAAEALQRLNEYDKDSNAFYSDKSICFNVTLQDMRKYYSGLLSDIEHLYKRGELAEYLQSEKKKLR